MVAIKTGHQALTLLCAAHTADIINTIALCDDNKWFYLIFREINIFIYINGRNFRNMGKLQSMPFLGNH